MAMVKRLYTQHALAKDLGISYSALGKILDDVEPEKIVKQRGREVRQYALRPVVDAMVAAEVERALGKKPRRGKAPPSSGADLVLERFDLERERARKEARSAERLEIEIRRLRGELVEASRVVKIWDAMLDRIRARLLSIPSRLAPLIQSAPDREYSTLVALIKGGVVEALEEAHRYQSDRLEGADEDDEEDPGEGAQDEGG